MVLYPVSSAAVVRSRLTGFSSSSPQCADSKVEALCEALLTTVTQWRTRFPIPLPLELYTSSNFIGLFVEEQCAEVLKTFAADFATEAASKAGEALWASDQEGEGVAHTSRVCTFGLSVLLKY